MFIEGLKDIVGCIVSVCIGSVLDFVYDGMCVIVYKRLYGVIFGIVLW